MVEPERGLIFETTDALLKGEYRVTSVYLGRVNFRRVERSKSGAIRTGRMYTVQVDAFEGLVERIVQEAPPQEEFVMPEIKFDIPTELPKEISGRAMRIKRY